MGAGSRASATFRRNAFRNCAQRSPRSSERWPEFKKKRVTQDDQPREVRSPLAMIPSDANRPAAPTLTGRSRAGSLA
jgi:hypothetical protein